MENIVNITEQLNSVEQQEKSKSLKFTLEKLEGGFVSDAEGKRKVYGCADDILDAVNMRKVVSKLDYAEYQVNISVVHKDEYQDYLDMQDLRSNYKAEEAEALTYEEAKEKGIIQVDKFNPNGNIVPSDGDDNSREIKVTIRNAYSVSRLKSIPWKEYNDQLYMSIPEKAEKAGLKSTSFYSMWNNMISGKALYNRPETRIGCTILAMYYEKNLGARSSSKEQLELLKENLLKELREIEVLTEQKFIKSSIISKKVVEIRKMLM